MFISQEHKVKVLLLKISFGLIQHPLSLFNNFPTVLVIYSTYKTNMYKMPMFEVVGVTSTDLTYSVGFGFMTHEKEENFVSVLQMMRKLLMSKMNMPRVIVTDRDMSLMKAIANVLPKSYAMNCTFMCKKMLNKGAS